jgi:D-aspartate ligase
LRDEVAKALVEDEAPVTIFRDLFTLRAILFAKTISLRASSKERAYWRAWTRRNAAYAVDLAMDYSDPLPGIIHALSETLKGLKAIPRFLRTSPGTSITVSVPAETRT